MYWSFLESMGAASCSVIRMGVWSSSHDGTNLRSPDIRAGMALLGATLCAKGQSIMSNVEQIDRGYEDLDTRLRALGAKIERAA